MSATSTESTAVAALGRLLTAYAQIDELLDQVAGSQPEGLTRAEKKRQSQSNKARDTAQSVYMKLITARPAK